MSINISLPIDQASTAVTTSITRSKPHPPTRRATTEMPITQAMLIVATPIAAAGPGDVKWAHGAINQSYNEPGLLTFSPRLSEAEVHDPRSG